MSASPKINWNRQVLPADSPLAGFVMGFLLGPLGVGIFLRSLLDFGLSAIACCLILSVFEIKGIPLCWMVCGGWVAFRVKYRLQSASRAVPARRNANSDQPRSA